jgi:hypothetical protein
VKFCLQADHKRTYEHARNVCSLQIQNVVVVVAAAGVVVVVVVVVVVAAAVAVGKSQPYSWHI